MSRSLAVSPSARFWAASAADFSACSCRAAASVAVLAEARAVLGHVERQPGGARVLRLVLGAGGGLAHLGQRFLRHGQPELRVLPLDLGLALVMVAQQTQGADQHEGEGRRAAGHAGHPGLVLP